MDYDYSLESLKASLDSAGVRTGDTLFIHVSLGRLGRLKEGATIEDMNRVLYRALTEAVGPKGNVLVPTYTYSIGRKQVYDVMNSPSIIGPFSEYFRLLPGSERSMDPMLAVSGQGPLVSSLFKELPKTCYGQDCVYERLREIGAKICTLGVGLYFATFRHHIEEMAQVPFRAKKKMRGIVRLDGLDLEQEWIYFAAPFLRNCQPNGVPLEKKIRAEGKCQTASVGRSELVVIGAKEYFEFGLKELARDPWFTALGPPATAPEMAEKMDHP